MHVNEQLSTEPRTEKRARIRARLRRNRAVAGSISVLVAIGVLVATIGSASADPSAGDWQKLRNCESGGNYATNTGNGYYGAYQFDPGTWRSVGGTGLPSDASPATQDALAYKLWQQRGWSPWTCASIVGLPAGGSGGPSRAVAVAAPAVVNQAGQLQAVTYNENSAMVVVTGWAADLNSAGYHSTLRITVNGVPTKASAAAGNAAAGVSGSHGFSVAIPATAGLQQVCATIMPKGSSATISLGCMNTTVVGEIRNRQSIRVSGGRVVTSGWVYDNTAASRSNKIVVSVNAAHYRLTANQSSGDVGAAFGIPGQHRFSGSYSLRKGKNIVCVYAVGANPKNTKRLECRIITV